MTRTLVLRGVVYTAVLNPRDDRKHWQDIVRAFCSSLREHDDATLVLKLIGSMDAGYGPLAALLARLRPFRCRVVATDAYLSGGLYERLARASTYAVNAASGEGQCLPLMEFMSCGTPAIAPCHTGMRRLRRRDRRVPRRDEPPSPHPGRRTVATRIAPSPTGSTSSR